MNYITGVKEKYNEELLQDRVLAEGLVIGCLYKDPTLFHEFKNLTAHDFLTEDAVFYFGLGKQMANKYNVFDQANVELFLSGNEILQAGFKARGGYSSIREITSIVSLESFNDYLDSLAKSNLILKFADEGIDPTKEVLIEGKKIKPIRLFKQMSAADVKNYYEARINAINVANIKQDIIIEDLMIDEEFIEDCQSGENLGASYSTVLNWIDENGEEQFITGLPIMSYLTGGIHKGEVTLLGGYSGLGKSSIVFTNYLLPLVNQNKKCCIISNEQKSKAFKQLLLAYVCAAVFKNYKITRRKIQTWSFTDDEKITVQKAMNYINTTFAGKLKFIKVFDYNIETVGSFIKKLALQDGFEYFLYDTFKAEDMTGSSVHGQMVEDSKYLFQIASKLNVAVLITQQLALHTEGQVSYLNASVLSSSKAVKEVVSELYLMRRVYNDIELDSKSKYYVNPHKLIKGEDGKWKKEVLELDKEKQYRLLFLDKTRNGEDSKCIILKFEGQYGIWHELGYANPSRNPLPR